MILVTIGTQLPFDRLIKDVDRLAEEFNLDGIAQIGPGVYRPVNLRWKKFLSHDQFSALANSAQCVIGHAGMGTIISALQYGRPAIIMARLAKMGEHRNDHQLATVERFRGKAGIYVVSNYRDLRDAYLRIINNGVDPVDVASPFAEPGFIQQLRDIIFQ